jgi:hypothetical protein
MSEVIELQTSDEQNRTFRVHAETPEAAVDLLRSRGVPVDEFDRMIISPEFPDSFIVECIR